MVTHSSMPITPVQRSSEVWTAARAIVSCLALAACGGKVTGDGDRQVDPSSEATPDAQDTPREPASCEAICTHVVRSCLAGAGVGSCVPECNEVRTMTACTPERDAFLACMLTTPVQCRGSEVVIVGCSDERNALERCAPGR